MSLEEPTERGQNELILELRGPMSEANLRRILDQIQVEGEVTRLRIEIASEEAVYHPFGITREAAEEPGEAATERPAETADTETSAADAEPGAGEEPATIPRLRTGGDTFHILKTVYDAGDWSLTDDVKESVPSEVNLDNVGSILWDLSDRGLLEKRPYEEDRRKTQYRVTSAGEQAVEQAEERAQGNA